jgi:putative MATE family efflux protein
VESKSSQTFDRSIIDGPLARVVWMLAWPTMLQNAIAGLQGIIDHIMVGHYVGYTANAAIGVSWQIIIVVIVFINSLFTGMVVLVSRLAGANDPETVNRVVYQALLTALGLFAIMGVVGWLAAPSLLNIVNAAPAVQHEALPFLRIMFAGIGGMMIGFMVGTAFRAAGDARMSLKLGLAATFLTILFNVLLIPRLGTTGAALGTVMSNGIVALVGLRMFFRPRSVIRFHRGMKLAPDAEIIRSLFRFGLPAGFQGIAMNVAGVMLVRFIGSLPQSAAAQAAYAVGYTELFSLITWPSFGLMGAAATIAGQNLGAGKPERTTQGVAIASRIGLCVAAVVGAAFLLIPHALLGIFGMTEPLVTSIGSQLLRFLSVSGFFVTVALTYTGGLQGTGDTRSPLYISIISQIVIPIGICAVLQSTRGLHATDIWTAILLGHFTRATLSLLRFRQGRWRNIAVEVERASAA